MRHFQRPAGAQPSDCLYRRAREEIIHCEHPLPTNRQLLAELARLKNDFHYIKSVDIANASKAYGVGPFEFLKRVKDAANDRCAKLMRN